MEELREREFNKTICVTLVKDKPFYEGTKTGGIYKYFREEFAVYGRIYKPTGEDKDKSFITLTHKHPFTWQTLKDDTRYYIIEI